MVSDLQKTSRTLASRASGSWIDLPTIISKDRHVCQDSDVDVIFERAEMTNEYVPI